ncbi:unnamed protein product [Linum trigynum]|uniref:Reverse transcriptase domain-containing protein n=1 Tax=Linum trigynum TaxID=586398 RepID=A0AAV2ECP5_9ROSI
MLQEVRRHCPVLSRWVEFCYSSPARLYYGMHSLWSFQGVQQGDPLGPLIFALVLHPLVCKIRDSFDLSVQAWYLDDGTVVGDTLVVGKVLDMIMAKGPRAGLHLNVGKTEVFWPTEDPRSRLPGVSPASIARPPHGVTVLGGPVSSCPDFSSELVAKRVTKTIELMDLVARIDDPRRELLLLRACTAISKLYFALRTCSPRIFGPTQLSFNTTLRSSLERIVTASGPGFGDWQWRLATFSFHLGRLGVYAVGDVLHYAFLASRLQYAEWQAKLLSPSGILSPGPTFDDALRTFNDFTGSDLLHDPSGVDAPKLMKKLADIYFAKVVTTSDSVFSLTKRQVALWKSQQSAHSSDWLRVVPIAGLGQTMNGMTYHNVLSYRLGIPLFSVSKPCPACSWGFLVMSLGIMLCHVLVLWALSIGKTSFVTPYWTSVTGLGFLQVGRLISVWLMDMADPFVLRICCFIPGTGGEMCV